MKRLLALLLSALLMLSLAACGGNDDPKPSGSDSTPSSSQQSNTNDNSDDDNDESSQPDDSDSIEALAQACCLPGLTVPDGCTFEEDRLAVFVGVAFSKEGGFTSDDNKAIINAVWELCKELSADGVYDVTNSGSTNTIKETYDKITDKYAEYDESELTEYELYWHYTFDGKVRQIKVLGGDRIRVVTADFGVLEK